MNFEDKLKQCLKDANGVFENIVWSTMRGQMLTLGTMTNDHVANSRHYHKHLAEVGRVAPEIYIDIEGCIFNQKLMERVIDSRKVAGSWDIDQSDFRLE